MSKVILPPPPPHPHPRPKDGLVEEDSKEFGLTEWEYERHLDEIDEAVREANITYAFKPVKQKLKLKPPSEKDRAKFHGWIRSKIRAADPEDRRKFCEMVEGVEF
jgi:hypothetical protein